MRRTPGRGRGRARAEAEAAPAIESEPAAEPEAEAAPAIESEPAAEPEAEAAPEPEARGRARGRRRGATHPGGRERLRVPFVGLTGGMGAGKSTALAALEQSGAAVLSTDRVVHELYDGFQRQGLRFFGDRRHQRCSHRRTPSQ